MTEGFFAAFWPASCPLAKDGIMQHTINAINSFLIFQIFKLYGIQNVRYNSNLQKETPKNAERPFRLRNSPFRLLPFLRLQALSFHSYINLMASCFDKVIGSVYLIPFLSVNILFFRICGDTTASYISKRQDTICYIINICTLYAPITSIKNKHNIRSLPREIAFAFSPVIIFIQKFSGSIGM